jgi:hypothetical protein
MIMDLMILEFLPFYKKERINYTSELEQNKIKYKSLKSELEEKRRSALDLDLNNPTITKKKFLWFNLNVKINKQKEINQFFQKQLEDLRRKNKESKLQAKINYMAAVSRHKELKENIKLIKKSKSNLHRVLYDFARLPYKEKKNSIVVEELSPSKEIEFSIKKRIFNDLDAFGDVRGDRIFAGEKDILFTTISFGNGVEKIPMVLRYSGQCVPIFLDKVRDDTYDKFSNENEHHLEVLCARFRDTKAPSKGLKIGRTMGMIIIGVILMIGYLGYKYYNGGL